MPGLSNEEPEIAALRARIASQRQMLARDAAAVWPDAKKAALMGGTAFLARKAAPFIRPIALGMLQRTIAKRGKFGLIKILGIAAVGLGAVKLLSGAGADAAEAPEE